MTISPVLMSELILLTEAVDLPGTDVARTLAELATDSAIAVDSYLGLSVDITTSSGRFDLTLLNQGVLPEQIHASVRIPLSAARAAGADRGRAPASIALILYAERPGAFMDLAADLAWLTGRPLPELRLDEDRTLSPDRLDPTPLHTRSTLNQALGVLIERGATPGQAERDLAARATAAGIDLLGAATLLLASLRPPSG